MGGEDRQPLHSAKHHGRQCRNTTARNGKLYKCCCWPFNTVASLQKSGAFQRILAAHAVMTQGHFDSALGAALHRRFWPDFTGLPQNQILTRRWDFW